MAEDESFDDISQLVGWVELLRKPSQLKEEDITSPNPSYNSAGFVTRSTPTIFEADD